MRAHASSRLRAPDSNAGPRGCGLGRPWGCLLVAAAATGCLLFLGAPVALAAAPPTGNAKAIAVYRQSASVMARYGGIVFDGTGVSYKVVPEPGYDNFSFWFGASSETGLRAAVDHVQLTQSGGRVIEELDRIKAPGLPQLRLWQRGPNRQVGEVMSPPECVLRVGHNTGNFVTHGRRFVSLDGHRFARPKRLRDGGFRISSSWHQDGGTAHEIAMIAPTGRWTYARVGLHGGPESGSRFALTHFRFDRHRPHMTTPRASGSCG